MSTLKSWRMSVHFLFYRHFLGELVRSLGVKCEQEFVAFHRYQAQQNRYLPRVAANFSIWNEMSGAFFEF